ncbi:MAG TPA: hypothetical protein PKW15_08695, partial [Alphaproteobacteria bacterium]|nr:hypothetical protein [Alphaproteobacteria bacterium]
METPFTIARFYCFADFPDYVEWQGRLKGIMATGGVRGTILIAPEGVNGTVAGPQSGIDDLIAALRKHPGFENLDPKFTPSDIIPFEKIKVRLKKEIITFKQKVDMSQTGQYHRTDQRHLD